MNGDVGARLAWPDDAPVLGALQLAAWRHDYADTLGPALVGLTADDLARPWASVLARPADARARVLVATEGPDLRGYALLHPAQDADADPVADGELGELVVSPDHRGAGHGSRLLQAAADTLLADGFTRATWWIPSTADDVRAFALGAGWAADGAFRELEGPGGARLRQVRLHTALVGS
ncbi:GNAT family N-acetyltransferase [Aeromicrobium sp. IC_218]|uniref:GNAT family N-acetyltransferase n=1 Tax=Aeromicrobium sp. IC_218 TaxID=2545468 RepID=UPI00103A4A7D|nr:GNAT family N-acetyltransferase [Aeromicrobium sp. IC_218]TCJ00257.1 GNAT family N-acetyltransferase [Aeromicrobium sp. IC_218]